jgi:hypothetical protein
MYDAPVVYDIFNVTVECVVVLGEIFSMVDPFRMENNPVSHPIPKYKLVFKSSQAFNARTGVAIGEP